MLETDNFFKFSFITTVVVFISIFDLLFSSRLFFIRNKVYLLYLLGPSLVQKLNSKRLRKCNLAK